MYCIPVSVCIITVLVLSWAQFWFCAVFRDVVLISVYCIPVSVCIITVLVLSWAQFWFCAVFRDVVLISVYCIPVSVCIITVLVLSWAQFCCSVFRDVVLISVYCIPVSMCIITVLSCPGHRVLVLRSFQGRGTVWGSRWLSAGRMTVLWDPPPTTLCPETMALLPCCIQLLGKRQTPPPPPTTTSWDLTPCQDLRGGNLALNKYSEGMNCFFLSWCLSLDFLGGVAVLLPDVIPL